MSKKKLNEKQKRFVEEYLIDLSATQAAIRAGYSYSTAGSIGSELLKKPEVAEAIETAIAVRSKRTGFTQDRVLRELAKVAFLNPLDVVDTDGRIKPDAEQDDLACIEGIKYKHSDSDTGFSSEREVKFASKLKALELLGKHLGMFNDKVDLNMTAPVIISGADQLED